MILNRDEIRKLILEEDMITGYVDLDVQLQPNGFDLTFDKLFRFTQEGSVDFNNKNRFIPNIEDIYYDVLIQTVEHERAFKLDKGVYLFEINETIKLPKDIFGISNQRSSVMRCGCECNVGFWDCGYNGKGYSILDVKNPHGIRLYPNAKLMQMIFIRADESEGYEGIYQHEGTTK